MWEDEEAEYEEERSSTAGLWITVLVCVLVIGGLGALSHFNSRSAPDGEGAAANEGDAAGASAEESVSGDTSSGNGNGVGSERAAVEGGTAEASPPPLPPPAPKPREAIVTKDIKVPLYSGQREIGYAGIPTGKQIQFLNYESGGKAKILYLGKPYSVPADSIYVENR